jgi:hypothetical protein
MGEDGPDLNFVPSIKKLLKEKCPDVKPRPPTIGVLALCARSFLDLLVDRTAVVCEELGRNQMEGKHVLTAVDALRLESIRQELAAKEKQISAAYAERKRMFGHHPISDRTPEENLKLMEQLRKEALDALRKRQAPKEDSDKQPNT